MFKRFLNFLGFDTKKQLRARLNKAYESLEKQITRNRDLVKIIDGTNELARNATRENEKLRKELSGAKLRITELHLQIEDLNGELEDLKDEMDRVLEII